MKARVAEKIKSIAVYGVLHFGEETRFDDDKFSTKDNLYQYRISKIKIFLGEKNLILGIQVIYKNLKGEEIMGAEGRNKNIKELDIQTLEIAPNDFLCYLDIFVGDDYITKLVFETKKGKRLSVGVDEGDDKIIRELNEKKDNIILSFFGGYRKSLEFLCCKYLPINEYLGPTMGYFELKKKLKHE